MTSVSCANPDGVGARALFDRQGLSVVTGRGGPAKLVLTTNIPTPYRLAFFQVLAEVAGTRDVAFEVLFYAVTEPNRRWKVDLESQRYPWTILPGFHPAIGNVYPHVNPTLPLVLRRKRASWVLIAGAWNTPSSLMAASRVLSGPGYRLLWSEGHAQAVLHPDGVIARARRASWARYDGFAVPNEASEQFVASELGRPAPCLRLPNTVDEDFYLAGSERSRADLRREVGLEPDDIAVLCVAELSDRKGVLELARAARLLPDNRRRQAVFIFAGDGPLRTAVVEAGGDARLRMLGHVDQETVRAWMRAADLFVLPSKVDPNPLSAIEAAFCGLPLILSERVGNSADLLSSGNSGWGLPQIEGQAIASVLASVLAVPEQRRRELGERARALAVGHFSRRKVAQHFMDALLQEFPLRPPERM